MPTPKLLYNLSSKIIKYPGMGGWYFLQVPKSTSAKLKADFAKHRRGWGSLKVKVTLGKTTWKTSIFPDSKSGTYVLPLKADVRKREKIDVSKPAKFTLEIQRLSL